MDREQMLLLSGNMTPEALLPNCSNCSQQGAPPGPGPEPALSVGKAVLLGLVLGVFLVLGVLGNVLVILWVALQRPLRSATHVFIGNLALADLLLSALVLPFSAALELRGRWALGRPLCDAWAALDVLCCTASILSLVAIAGDRYVGVSYPLRYPALVTPRRAGLALVGVWALAAAISVGPLLGWKEEAPADEGECRITQEPAYAIFSAVGSFYAPLAVLLVMYARVYVVACRETRALREGRKTEPSERVTLRVHRGNTAASEDHAHTHTHRALRLLKFSREKRAAKTLGIVVGCFVLCWLPFFIVLPIGSMFPAYRPSETVFKVTFWLGYFNSCINPLIYPCSSAEFKRAFLSLLGRGCLRRRAHTHTHTPSHTHSHTHTHTPPRTHTHSHTHASPQPQRSSLGIKGRPSPSPSPSMTPSHTSSAMGGADWAGASAGGVRAAGLCSKSLFRTCCCVRRDTHTHAHTHSPESTHTPAKNTPPVIKIHKLSLCENGDAV